MRIINRKQPCFGRDEATHTLIKEGLTSSPVKRNNQLIFFPGYEGDLQTYLTDYNTFWKWCWTAQKAPRVQLLDTAGIGDNAKIVNFSILSGPPQIRFSEKTEPTTDTFLTAPVSGLTTYQDWDTSTTTQNLSGVALPRVYKTTALASGFVNAAISTQAKGASGSGQFIIRATYGDYTEDQAYQLYNIGDDRYTLLSKLYISRPYYDVTVEGRADNTPSNRITTMATTGLLKVVSRTMIGSCVPNVPFTIAVTSGYIAGANGVGLVHGVTATGAIVESFTDTTSGWVGANDSTVDEEMPGSAHALYGSRFVKVYDAYSNYTYSKCEAYNRMSGVYDFVLRNNTGSTQYVTLTVTSGDKTYEAYYTVLNG